MFVSDFYTLMETPSIEDLLEFLKRRSEFDANFFQIGIYREGYPELSAHVKGNICVVYYTDLEEQFVSDGTVSEAEDTVTFYEDGLKAEVNLAGECVISVDEMAEAAKEFFLTHTRPTCLLWQDL